MHRVWQMILTRLPKKTANRCQILDTNLLRMCNISTSLRGPQQALKRILKKKPNSATEKC